MDVTLISQPDIEIFGIRVMEPVTSITDILVAATCIYAYARLRKAKLQSRTALFMEWYFLTMAAATFFGGMIGHAFLYAVNEYWKLLGWFISMASIALIERAAIQHATRLISPTLGKTFLIINIVELLTFMVITAVTLHFRFVQIHIVYGLLVVVFSFQLFVYLKTRDVGSKIFLRAIAVLIVAGFIFNYPIVLHKWFNHRDFAHILMAIGTIIFLKGTLKLGELPQKTRESN